MTDKLIEILETTGYEVYQQGSMSDDTEYPDTFITFWNFGSHDHAYYDNADYGTRWEYEVNAYSNNRVIVLTLFEELRRLLKENGFICPSRGHDVMSDEPTHTGRGMEVYYLETEV